MSRGGFSAFAVDMIGKSVFDINDIYNTVKEVSQKIIDTDQGWSLDESLNATINDGLIIPDVGMIVFLKHTKGTRIAVMQNATGGGSASSKGYGIDYTALYTPGRQLAQNYRTTGLAIAMIPPFIEGSFDRANYNVAGKFMPAKSIRFHGRAYSSGSVKPLCFYEDDTMDGKTLRFIFSIKDDTIIMASHLMDTTEYIVQALGDIIIPCDPEDPYTYAQFAPRVTGGKNEGNAANLLMKYNDSTSMLMASSGADGCGALYTKNGGYITGGNVIDCTATTRVVYHRNSLDVRDIRTNTRAFNAIHAGFYSATDTDNILPVRKGIINTEIIAQIHCQNDVTLLPVNTLLDGGNYLHVGSGICIGWDPSNAGIEI